MEVKKFYFGTSPLHHEIIITDRSKLPQSGLTMFSPTEITDPQAEILSGMAQMAKDEIRSVAETTDLSQLIIIDPESL